MSEIKPGYTRISAVSSAFAGYGSIKQHVLDRAAARGSCVHKIIQDTMNHIVIPKERWEFMGDRLEGYFASWEQFYAAYEWADVIMQEERLDDDERLLTGEPDLLISHGGENILIDWKCTSGIGRHWKIQASGYRHLLKDYQVDLIYFVRLDKNGKAPDVISIKPDREQFFAAYDLYKEYLFDKTCCIEDE